MTLQQLNYFCAIAREKSFRKAAEILYVSQPSLSNAIARLEEELGFSLFERKGRNIELTKYGRYYFQQMTPLLEQIKFVNDKVRNLAIGSTGHIDLAYNAPFGKRIVPKMARVFLEQPENKNCVFHFHQANSSKIIEGLISSRFDVGICTVETNNKKIEYVPIMKQELVGIVPLNNPLAGREKISLKELAKFPYIEYIEETGIHSLIRQIWDEENLSPQIIAKAPDEESIAALVAEGFGVSFIASIKMLKNFDVAILKIDRENCFRTIYMTYAKENYLTPAVQRFIKTAQKPEYQPER